MSELTHCDGPGCAKIKDRFESRPFCAEPWIRVEDRPGDSDFCSRACLIAWAS